MVFGGLLLVKPSFSREKDGFAKDGCSKQSFSREKDGFEPKNHLFLEKTKKTKKTKKTIFSKTMGLGPSKDGFFGFLEKKMVSNQKNHLFLEKTKKTIFWRPQPHSFGKDGFFGFFGFFVFFGFFWFVGFC